jgi:hypothetical protein
MVQKHVESCADGKRSINGPQQNMASVIGSALASIWASQQTESSTANTPPITDSVNHPQDGQPNLTAASPSR